VVRRWDLARAAKAKKVGFWAGIEGYFFILGVGGGARGDVKHEDVKHEDGGNGGILDRRRGRIPGDEATV
jgi:hypothetical protein